MQLFQAKAAIVEVCHLLWQRGYVAANDGNVSLRLDDQRVVATPTGVSKGRVSAEMLIVTDLEGTVLAGEGRPSSELKMHLAVYRRRPDVHAVVHAHPPVATAFAVAGMALDKALLPETVLTIGAVPVVPYGTPSTPEVPEALEPFIPRCNAVLLANHGAVTWDATVHGAYYKMESLEHTATITQHAMLLGNLNLLGQGDVDKLLEVRKRMGFVNPALPCQTGVCPFASSAAPAPARGSVDASRVERVVREVLESHERRR